MQDQDRFATAIHDVVEESANSIEEIHKKIAGLPFDLLENVHILKGPLKEIRKIQDNAIRTVYGVVRDVNEEITRLAVELAEPKKESPPRKRGAVKTRPREKAH